MTRPYLKWVGGKHRSLDSILSALPERIGTYYEPFLGGGAVFFALAERGRFTAACLSDTNQELIQTFTAVRDHADRLIAELRRLTREPVDRNRYYELLARKPRGAVGIAARMIMLNHTGFNGLYRVNLRGEFNVPFGRYSNPHIFDAGHLKACSQLLQGVRLLSDHYFWAVAEARPGDAVYLDPPYLQYTVDAPQTGFHGYTPGGFDVDAHRRLASACTALTERGIAWATSNADNTLVRTLYQHPGTQRRCLTVNRTVSAKASTRGKAVELLFWHRPEQAAAAESEK